MPAGACQELKHTFSEASLELPCPLQPSYAPPMRVLRLTLLLLPLATVTASADTWWIPAHAFGPESLTVAQPGEYRIWGWGQTGASLGVEVAGQPIDARARPADGAYDWRLLGRVELAAGPVAIGASENLVGLLITDQPRLRPEEAMRHRRVLSEPVAVQDDRYVIRRHTDTVYPSRWLTRWGSESALRNRILVSAGLAWSDHEPHPSSSTGVTEIEPVPLPPPSVFDETVQDGFRVANVAIETKPGYFLTGNLYRPLGDGPYPGVASPHGHWGNGRLEDSDKASVPQRCATLARMGFVVFAYDMVGYVDNDHWPHNWGTKEDKLWGLHPFALQLMNGRDAVTYLQSLPEVDPERIGMTGASGGGTQTFMLKAVDPRVKVSAPVNMISHTMQGGCPCENAPLIRIDHSNVEIASLAAPRPMLMVSASGDWTRETPFVEYPRVQRRYASVMLLRESLPDERLLRNVHIDAPHNYNRESRMAMYRFFAEHLLGDETKAPEDEQPHGLDVAALRVFPGGPPEHALGVRDFLEQEKARRAQRIEKELASKEASLLEFELIHRVGSMLSFALRRDRLQAIPYGALASTRHGRQMIGDYIVEQWTLDVLGRSIPMLFYRSSEPGPQTCVLLVHEAGKAALAGDDGPGDKIRALLDAGFAVLTIDVFLTGEHHAPAQRTERTGAGPFDETFAPTVTAARIADIVFASRWLTSRPDVQPVPAMFIAGFGDAALWVAAASAFPPAGLLGTPYMLLPDRDLEDDAVLAEHFYLPGARAAGIWRHAFMRAEWGNTVDAHDAPRPWQEVVDVWKERAGRVAALRARETP